MEQVINVRCHFNTLTDVDRLDDGTISVNIGRVSLFFKDTDAAFQFVADLQRELGEIDWTAAQKQGLKDARELGY